MFRPWKEHVVARNVVSRRFIVKIMQFEPAVSSSRLLYGADEEEEDNFSEFILERDSMNAWYVGRPLFMLDILVFIK